MRFFTGGSGLGGTIVCGPVAVATRISRQAQPRVEQRELLSQPASPGDTQDVGLLVAQVMQHLAQEQGQGGETVRPVRQLKPPSTGGSKRITSMAGSSASTNGRRASSRMPTPLHGGSGGPAPVPGRGAQRAAASRPPA